jgi:hypothetical protein
LLNRWSGLILGLAAGLRLFSYAHKAKPQTAQDAAARAPSLEFPIETADAGEIIGRDDATEDIEVIHVSAVRKWWDEHQ